MTLFRDNIFYSFLYAKHFLSQNYICMYSCICRVGKNIYIMLDTFREVQFLIQARYDSRCSLLCFEEKPTTVLEIIPKLYKDSNYNFVSRFLMPELLMSFLDIMFLYFEKEREIHIEHNNVSKVLLILVFCYSKVKMNLTCLVSILISFATLVRYF